MNFRATSLSCSGAPAPKCAGGSWQVNRGHHLLGSGGFLFFNNGTFGGTSPSQAYEFTLGTSASISATQVKAYTSSGGERSDSLGDVQRLLNGNTIIMFSNNGVSQDLDASWTRGPDLEGKRVRLRGMASNHVRSALALTTGPIVPLPFLASGCQFW